MRLLRAIAVVALAAALAVPVAGCGKSKPKIPKTDARELVALLKQADARSRVKACNGLARVTIPQLIARVNGLPANVDPDIRDTLRQGIDNLRNLVAIQCTTVKPTPPATSTETQTQSAPPPTTTTTTTQPPTTQPPTTKPPTTKPPTTPPPSNPSGGSPGQPGGGGGNGQ